MTNIIVKNYTVLYTYVEVMSCQSDRFPEMFMISETPSIRGEIKTHQMRE